MGLYIKNLKMSEHCMDCPFMVSRDNDDCILQSDEANENFESWEQMKAGCPLIEVPEPHGRLGDLDALMLIIREYIDEYGELDENGFHSEKWCAMKEAEMVICEAPTVIPASKED